MTETANLTTLAEKVEASLTNIREYLRADGGDVKVRQVSEDGEVTLELIGACADCSMSEMTMKAGVEKAIRGAVPGASPPPGIGRRACRHNSGFSRSRYLRGVRITADPSRRKQIARQFSLYFRRQPWYCGGESPD